MSYLIEQDKDGFQYGLKFQYGYEHMCMEKVTEQYKRMNGIRKGRSGLPVKGGSQRGITGTVDLKLGLWIFKTELLLLNSFLFFFLFFPPRRKFISFY